MIGKLTIDVAGLSDEKISELEWLIEQWKQQELTREVPKLSEGEQQLLTSAGGKIRAINKDMLNSTRLTRDEADVAAKAGLIDPGQKYWWTEEWQESERDAERDIRAGRVEAFDTPEAFRKALQSL